MEQSESGKAFAEWLKQYASKADGVYFLSPAGTSQFEDWYLAVRAKEGRLFSDRVVSQFPYPKHSASNSQEWKMRSRSFRRLYNDLSKFSGLNILEVGCGNGWTGGKLATLGGVTYFGADINIAELKQAARVWPLENAYFFYWDVFQEKLPAKSFDVILLISTIQYFPDLSALIRTLMPLLKSDGNIHILDSPFYKEDEIENAKNRTLTYYQDLGFPGMSNHYFHHKWNELEGFDYQILYKYSSFLQKVKRQFKPDTPFPWIAIKNEGVKTFSQ